MPASKRKRPSKPEQTTAVDSNSDGTLEDVDASANLTASYDEGYHTSTADDGVTQKGPSQDHAARSNSFDNAAINAIFTRANELLRTISKLEAIGVENLDVKLPKIVVVGDQSAGKSSLLEAICDIKVLRKSGACTRCPLRISLIPSQDENWSCNVSIHKAFDLYDESMTPSNSRYGPWQKKDYPDVKPFRQIQNKDELEDVLRRAQFAILNPSTPTSYFATCETLPERYQQEFSPNVISLEIKGPTVRHLSFYDLPGVIAASEDAQSAYLIKLIERLVRDYVDGEDNIILLACSMEVDRATSTASNIVHRLGANDRCIGVLTKADRFPVDGDIGMTKAILENKKYKLGHGYFVTKQPSQNQLDQNISHSEARDCEKEFFQQEPWSTALGSFEGRFGSQALQTKLSELLVTEIHKALPRIRGQIDEKMAVVKAKLDNLPEPPAESVAFNIVMTTISNFAMKLDRYIEGEPPNNSFRLKWKELRKGYHQAMMERKPVLVVKGNDDLLKGDQHQPIPVEDDVDEDMSSPSNRKRPAPSMQPPTTPKRARMSVTPAASRSRPSKGIKMGLDEVRVVLQNMSASGLPNNIDPKAEDALIRQSIERWDEPLHDFLNASKVALFEQIHEIIEGILAQWRNTLLYQEMYKAVNDYLDEKVESAFRRAKECLAAEKLKPLTNNEEWLQYHREKELTMIWNAREEARAKPYLEDKTPGKDQSAKVKSMIVSLGSDPYTKEIEVMGTVRAYYNVAAATLVDTVTKIISFNLFEECKNELASFVQTTLKLQEGETPVRCQRLLSEDAEREEMRERYKKEKEKLLEAKASLDNPQPA